MKKRHLWLCVPPLLLCLIDHIITLIFQPPEYWSGALHTANEANPHFNWLLQQHWLAFEAGIVAWIAVFCLLILFGSARFAFLVSLSVTIGHTWGAGTWISHRFAYGYWMTLALCFMSSIMIATTAENAGVVTYSNDK